MALQMNEWEVEQLRQKRVVEEAAKVRRKRAFIKKWTSATPKKQAEILWDIINRLERIALTSKSLILKF